MCSCTENSQMKPTSSLCIHVGFSDKQPPYSSLLLLYSSLLLPYSLLPPPPYPPPAMWSCTENLQMKPTASPCIPAVCTSLWVSATNYVSWTYWLTTFARLKSSRFEDVARFHPSLLFPLLLLKNHHVSIWPIISLCKGLLSTLHTYSRKSHMLQYSLLI